jgi:hypothetical protein
MYYYDLKYGFTKENIHEKIFLYIHIMNTINNKKITVNFLLLQKLPKAVIFITKYGVISAMHRSHTK